MKLRCIPAGLAIAAFVSPVGCGKTMVAAVDSGRSGDAASETDAPGSLVDGSTPSGPTCPPALPRSDTSPDTPPQPCSMALMALAGCTYPSDVPDAGACFETFICYCGVEGCFWRSQGIDCTGAFDACNPVSGNRSCAGARIFCLGCPSAPNPDAHYCSTTCMGDNDCTDPRRPRCSRPLPGPGGASQGLCTPPAQICSW